MLVLAFMSTAGLAWICGGLNLLGVPVKIIGGVVLAVAGVIMLIISTFAMWELHNK